MSGTLWRIRQSIARPGWALGRLGVEWRARFGWEERFAKVREPRRRGAYVHAPGEHAAIRAQLEAAGFDVRPLRLDADAYRRFVARARYERFPLYCSGGRSPGFVEKGLEHFLALELLGLTPDDVYIDVASQHSPVPVIYGELSGARMIRQDLVYPPGLHEDRIGGDASSMPVPDGFASAIALHNAFEHFEGDSDSRFIGEALRVLRPGGRLCIVPLFLASRYAIQTDPAAWPPEGMAFEPDAELWCAKGWRDRHGRLYDVAHLAGRVRARLPGASLTIHDVENAGDFGPDAYLRFAALVRKPG